MLGFNGRTSNSPDFGILQYLVLRSSYGATPDFFFLFSKGKMIFICVFNVHFGKNID